MTSESSAALRCTGLVKRYGDVLAVDGIDLEVGAGECFGLLGPNGAGKTTTIEILEGLLQPDDGTVEILGCQWGHDDEALRQRLGIHLQETQLDERLTVLETLQLFRAFYTEGRTIDSVLDLLGLRSKSGAWVSKLSGGQRQRLAVGCALIGDPQLLFLDEPTTGLDPQSRRQLWGVLDRFRELGGSILITTHYMDEAQTLCDRVAIVDQGRVIALGSPAQLITSLGAAHVITFGTETAPDDPERVGAQLADLAGVHSAKREGENWLLTSSDLHVALPAVLDFAETGAVTLTSLTTHTATLEDVFMSYTGRHLRDG